MFYLVFQVTDTLASNRTDLSPTPDDFGVDNLVAINVLSQSDKKGKSNINVMQADQVTYPFLVCDNFLSDANDPQGLMRL